jgi:hypothetical protein
MPKTTRTPSTPHSSEVRHPPLVSLCSVYPENFQVQQYARGGTAGTARRVVSRWAWPGVWLHSGHGQACDDGRAGTTMRMAERRAWAGMRQWAGHDHARSGGAC